MNDKTANIVEIFSSTQGEGIYLGYKQVFIRFAECNLDCAYCDTNFKLKENVLIEEFPAKQDFLTLNNPIDIETLFYYIKKLDTPKGIHHSISLTGGEPLLQSDFLKVFLADNFAKHKFKIYLETNGTLPEELKKIIKFVDIVSMDIKLPSSSKNTTDYWHEHKAFLEILAENQKSKLNYFVKVVVDDNFTTEELYNIIWCVASSESKASVVLQPEFNNPPEPQKLLKWQSKLLKQLDDVRIIPQTHKLIGLS